MRSISTIRPRTFSRNQRSWLTTRYARRSARSTPSEPYDAGDVEVVGRLVEEENVGARAASSRAIASRFVHPPESVPRRRSDP
jgi:hypothetical protein